jgi:hypothetical protein
MNRVDRFIVAPHDLVPYSLAGAALPRQNLMVAKLSRFLH